MSLVDNGNMYMPVAPAYAGGNGGIGKHNSAGILDAI